jgi:curved DNA-binding protein CbpA
MPIEKENQNKELLKLSPITAWEEVEEVVGNYYEILGISEEASEEEIRSAYRKLALKCHPDKLSRASSAEKEVAEEKMKQISQIYQVLMDPQKRVMYDADNLDQDFKSGDYVNALKNCEKFSDEWFEVMKEWDKREIKKNKRLLKQIALLIELCERRDAIFEIQGLMLQARINYTKADYLKYFDSSLWSSYESWEEKIREIEFANLESFKKQMTEEIKQSLYRKTEEKKKEKWRTQFLSQVKILMMEKGLEPKHFEEPCPWDPYKDWEDMIKNIQVDDVETFKREKIEVIEEAFKKRGESDKFSQLDFEFREREETKDVLENNQNNTIIREWSVLQGGGWLSCFVVGGEGVISNGKETIHPIINKKKYRKIKKSIINDIKQSPNEWDVKRIEYFVVLFHSPEYDRSSSFDNANNLDKYGNFHWKSGFTEEEWSEITQVLNLNEESEEFCKVITEQSPTLSGKVKFAVIASLLLFFSFIFYRIFRKKEVNKKIVQLPEKFL